MLGSRLGHGSWPREPWVEAVADLLGHKDVRMLAQVYRHRVKRVVDLTEAQGRMLGEG